MMVYIVNAYRYGNAEDHIYTVGVFSSLEKAEKAAVEHVEDRDGKYDCVVYACELDSDTSLNAICTYRGIGLRDRVESKALNEGF